METIKERIDELLAKKNMVIVAIDGKCTSGKTTLASKLAEIYDCNVFHMDDFFLRPEQRIPERLAEVGGNVDYERFQEEVIHVEYIAVIDLGQFGSQSGLAGGAFAVDGHNHHIFLSQ